MELTALTNRFCIGDYPELEKKLQSILKKQFLKIVKETLVFSTGNGMGRFIFNDEIILEINLLEYPINSKVINQLTSERIIKIIIDYYKITLKNFYSHRKTAEHSLSRHIVIYFLSTMLKLSQKDISFKINKTRDTVQHALTKIRGLIDIKDKKIIKDISNIKKIIKEYQ